jgi:hypothetical protein
MAAKKLEVYSSRYRCPIAGVERNTVSPRVPAIHRMATPTVGWHNGSGGRGTPDEPADHHRALG